MILATALVAVLPLAAPLPPVTRPTGQKWEMTTYTLVLVRPGAADKQPREAEIREFQQKHEALLRDLGAKRKALAWGAIEGSQDLQEVIILDVDQSGEARALFEGDPWFRTGARVLELHPWYAANGILKAAPAGAPEAPATFGLLRRPPDAPDYPKEKLNEIQKGHMANIEAMAASGDLVIAGPLGDDGTLRGVFVFRGTDEKHLREIAAPDAAIQAGRLVLDLYTWKVPQGTLPPR